VFSQSLFVVCILVKRHEAYIDDNQLYIHCSAEDAQLPVLSVQQCVSVINMHHALHYIKVVFSLTASTVVNGELMFAIDSCRPPSPVSGKQQYNNDTFSAAFE